MKKSIYTFSESHKEIADYEELGFTSEIDDPVNGIYYIEKELDDSDWIAVLAVLEDCERKGLDPSLEVEEETFLGIKDAITYVNDRLIFG